MGEFLIPPLHLLASGFVHDPHWHRATMMTHLHLQLWTVLWTGLASDNSQDPYPVPLSDICSVSTPNSTFMGAFKDRILAEEKGFVLTVIIACRTTYMIWSLHQMSIQWQLSILSAMIYKISSILLVTPLTGVRYMTSFQFSPPSLLSRGTRE